MHSDFAITTGGWNGIRIFSAAGGFTLCAALALTVAAATLDSAAVDRRAAEWQPSARERQWEQIAWQGSLKSALETAKELRRPVFLFTHDGRLNVGRC